MNPSDEQNLEKLISQQLRALPPRRAPQSLEGRVLGAIAARQAMPWWKKSFVYWPLAIRLGFLGFGLAAAVSTVFLCMYAMGGVHLQAVSSILRPGLEFVSQVRAVGNLLLDLVGQVTSFTLPMWLYAILGGIVAAYAVLFGLGATAYRVLWQAE